MPATHRLLAACALVLATSAGAAEAPAKTTAPEPGEPKVERTVTEDDAVCIDELKVRGAAQKVTVHHKGSRAPDYEIQLEDAGRQSAAGSDRGSNGRRVWRLLNF